jgi:Integral membrane protein
MWLRPNRALSRRGLRRLIVVLAALALTTAGLGAWQGNVFAPLFALVESFAVAFALGRAWRAGDRSERITLGTSSLEVRSLPGRRCVRFQPYWVRVQWAPGNGRGRLLLRSHGRELEIGAFLADEERAELSRKLVALLADVNNPQRR